MLQKRGLAQTEYAPGTLREQLFPGRGPRINERHDAARYRGAFKTGASEAVQLASTRPQKQAKRRLGL